MFVEFNTAKFGFLFLLVMGLNPDAAAEASEPSINRLVAMLLGEFDSYRQAQDDQANDVDEDLVHGRVNRTFAIVDAPDVGDVVVVGTTSYGLSPWRFDTDEFLIWTFAVEERGKGIAMAPRRFKDIERRIPFAYAPRKLGGFATADLKAAISGASCEIVWSPTSNGFSGRTKPCQVMSTTRNAILHWEWQYELTETAMWISFSGKDESGKVLDSTPLGVPYRLDRIRSDVSNGRIE